MNDKTTSNTANVYKFPCDDGASAQYDVTNGQPSTRNSAFKWGSEAASFLKRVSSTRWQFDVSVEREWAVVEIGRQRVRAQQSLVSAV